MDPENQPAEGIIYPIQKEQCISKLFHLGNFKMANIVYLEDHEDLRNSMSDLMKIHLDEECLCLSSVDELKARKTEFWHSKLVILDINLGLGCPSGLDAYQWLQAEHFPGKIFFLTGHAKSHPLVAKAGQTGARIWEKPFSTSELLAEIKTALNKS